ncbi:uncharacterized protein LOC134251129 [Saccostrea cucullata]|uniref:uncharacterized protein LOC134251129 n=1 Tax=Saccostrea cuccullata TaxID=36930 RepID=UPI002ED0D8BE
MSIFKKLSGTFQIRKRTINCITNSSYVRERTLYIQAYGGCEENSWCGENEECLRRNYGALGYIGTCVCLNDTLRLNSICRKVDLSMGEPCTFDIQCSKAGYNRVCDKATSTCKCFAGFREINGHCIRTDLEVNQTCWYDEQCNATANSSVCRKNICVCTDEHYFANGSCQPYKKVLPAGDTETSKNPQPLQERGDTNIAQNVAAVISGFVLGILTCLAAVYLIHLRSRRREQNRNTEAKLVNNISYGKELPINIQTDSKNLQQAKISHVKPIIKRDPEYSNTHQVKSETNDIYNHLNEKLEDDTIDVYDHAVTGASGMSNEEEYTHLSR